MRERDALATAGKMPALRGGGGYCFRIQLDILSSAIGDICLFDLRVFGEGAGFRGLEEMVESRQFVDFEVLVATFLQCFADGREILLRQYLLVQLSVEDQHRASYNQS